MIKNNRNLNHSLQIKLFLAVLFLFVINYTYAQNTFPNTGNTGIGTLSPATPLDVQSNTTNSVFHVRNSIPTAYSSTLIYGQMVLGDSPNYDLVGLYNNNNTLKYQVRGDGQVYMTGNVGIGTTSPSGQLDIWRPASNGTITRFATLFDTGQAVDLKAIQSSPSNGYFSFDLSPSTLGWQKIVVPVGSVGIGTTDPGSYKLAVKGSIHAQSVNVDMIGWSDYVFKSGYNLHSLQYVKSYIDKNGHLPDIPSEEQVKKEGIDLGEMNSKLLKKIEELTLYLIEKDNELKEQNKQLRQQQQIISDQQTRLEIIDKKLNLK